MRSLDDLHRAIYFLHGTIFRDGKVVETFSGKTVGRPTAFVSVRWLPVCDRSGVDRDFSRVANG